MPNAIANALPARYRALRVVEEEPGRFVQKLEELPAESLPPGEVLIAVEWSSLNYKDALSATGHKGVTRQFPHTPGIDAAGCVVESAVSGFHPGDAVVVTGFELGSTWPGGYAEYIRVPAAWVVRKPEGLTLRQCMLYGTAGFTAAYSVARLRQNGITPDRGDMLVTGASGGVGSVAVGILARLGYAVVAGTGKPDFHPVLKRLGAAQFLTREEMNGPESKPLLAERWGGGVDAVGGNILATALKSCRHNGAIAACGLTQSTQLALTVYPFILRGVSLLGIDSVHCPRPLREDLWRLLATDWKPAELEALAVEVSLERLPEKIADILAGRVAGRVLVRIR